MSYVLSHIRTSDSYSAEIPLFVIGKILICYVSAPMLLLHNWEVTLKYKNPVHYVDKDKRLWL